MLALSPSRQHIPLNASSTLPSPSSPQQQLSFDQLSQQLSAQQFFNQKLLHDYLESQSPTFATPASVDDNLSSEPNPFMTTASFDFSNPTIRIQQSTPTPQLRFSQPSMLPTHNATAATHNNWNTYANNGHMGSQSLQTPVQSRSGRTHHRASSSSSIGSNGSQYQAVGLTTGYSADEASRGFSNHHLPTPTPTPTQDSFLNSTFNDYTSAAPGMDSTMAAHISMKQALMDQHVPDEDVPGFGHSARQSVSSYGHNSPATPHTSHGDDFEDRFKMPTTDLRHTTVPKFERTYTDVALDTFYDPSSMAAPSQSMTQNKPATIGSMLSPYRSGNPNDIVQRTLQAAQNARSQSPSSSASRGVSPFRHNSPFRQPNGAFSSPRMRGVATAAQAREQNVEADAAYAMKSKVEEAQPKTISPKDALLDYREADDESKVPLFPDGGASEYDHQYNGGDQYRNATQSNYDTTSGQSYRRDSSWVTPQFSPNFSTTTAGPSPPTSSFSFAPPAISGNMHGLPFTSTQYRSVSNNMPSASDQTPEFPAHLTSMESSASEAGPETMSISSEALQKPAPSTADTGTYSCTYHGCTQRFETPQKLQKHKREGHRNASVATSMTSAALLERNSQAGPHKCERTNPTTGKPCNTIFSRPYDLTRHEDTIHNARKQKVRCALCVEEKTFSRNDALTRHMRVVHPEIDFPGKHRRRGGNHD